MVFPWSMVIIIGQRKLELLWINGAGLPNCFHYFFAKEKSCSMTSLLLKKKHWLKKEAFLCFLLDLVVVLLVFLQAKIYLDDLDSCDYWRCPGHPCLSMSFEGRPPRSPRISAPKRMSAMCVTLTTTSEGHSDFQDYPAVLQKGWVPCASPFTEVRKFCGLMVKIHQECKATQKIPDNRGTVSNILLKWIWNGKNKKYCTYVH